MKGAIIRTVVCLIVLGIALTLHSILIDRIAAKDPISDLLVGHGIVTIAQLLPLLCTRVFLFVLGPGWVLYCAILLGRAIAAKQMGKRKIPEGG
jgi:hypothetical protein